MYSKIGWEEFRWSNAGVQVSGKVRATRMQNGFIDTHVYHATKNIKIKQVYQVILEEMIRIVSSC
jgi:hypothetical protein